MRVLIVENHPNVRALLAEVLSLAGHRVITALSGSTALQLASQMPIDAVLTDLEVASPTATVLDGVALAQALRQGRPNLPILCLTHHPDDPRLAASAFLFDAVFSKPCSLTDLCSALDRLSDRVPDRIAA